MIFIDISVHIANQSRMPIALYCRIFHGELYYGFIYFFFRLLNRFGTDGNKSTREEKNQQ